MPKVKNPSKKFFNFVINNYTDEDVQRLKEGSEDIRYISFQKEIGESGTPHLQGYLETKSNNMRFSTISKSLKCPTMAIKEVDSKFDSDNDNVRERCRNYTRKKDDTYVDGPWEFGEWNPPKPGKRNDILALKEAILGGANIDTIERDHFALYFHNDRMCEKLINKHKKIYKGPVEIHVWWGPNGRSKSWTAMRKFGYENTYLAASFRGGILFDDYNDQETIVVDEFEGAETMDYISFKKIFNSHTDGTSLPCRYANKPSMAKRIIFVSNKDPIYWYKKEDREGLFRRFTSVMDWTNAPIFRSSKNCEMKQWTQEVSSFEVAYNIEATIETHSGNIETN